MSKMKLNTFHLKIIALIFMLIDHLAYVFLIPNTPLYIVLRCIGRLSAPIFWFCFTEGYKHTSNKELYFTRLFIASVVMALVNTGIGFFLSLNVNAMSPNMFASMALMVLVIEQMRMVKLESTIYRRVLSLISLILTALVVLKFAEYGIFILFIVPIFYFINDKFIKYSAYCMVGFILSILMLNIYQMFMIFAVLFFVFYGDKKPRYSLKWFFYVFYPVHLWIFYLIYYFINK